MDGWLVGWWDCMDGIDLCIGKKDVDCIVCTDRAGSLKTIDNEGQ